MLGARPASGIGRAAGAVGDEVLKEKLMHIKGQLQFAVALRVPNGPPQCPGIGGASHWYWPRPRLTVSMIIKTKASAY